MIDRLSPRVRNVALVTLFVLLAWFCWIVRSVLNPLILGYLLAFILHPLVLRLEKRGWTRRKAVNLIFGGSALGVTLLCVGMFFQAQGLVTEFTGAEGLGTKVGARVDEFIKAHPEKVQWAIDLLPQRDNAPNAPSAAELRFEDLWLMLKDAWTDWLTEEQRSGVTDLGAKAGLGIWLFVQKVFGGMLELFGLLLLWPIYTYFLLFELERIHTFLTRYLPYQDRDRIVRITSQIGEVLASFFRGRLLVCLIKGAFLALGFWIGGVDYALLLGLASGFLSLIPFVGAAIGYTLAFLIAVLEFGVGDSLLRTGIAILLAEALENYLLIPKIIGDSLGLHPIVVIFAIMAGGASMGMFGLLMALPITASLVILCREFLLPVLAQMADKEAPRPPKPARG